MNRAVLNKCEPEEGSKGELEINILVVCNSKHHSVNLINLAENLFNLSSSVSVVALCEPQDMEYYSQVVNKDKTRLLSIDYAKEITNESLIKNQNHNIKHITKPSLKNKYVEKIFGLALHLNNVLSGKIGASNFILKTLRETSPICYLREKKAKAFYTKRKEMLGRIFDEIKPTVVFCFGDRHIDIEVPVLLAARSRNIKIVIPYTSFSGSEGLLKVRKIQKEPKRWWPVSLYRIYAAIRLKNQILQGYFYQHPSVLFALSALDALSSNPWCIGNGLSNVVCVDSQHTFDRYKGEGVPEEKLSIIGDVAYDTLFKNHQSQIHLRKEIVEEYLLMSDKKIIVIALPQFAEQGLLNWNEHWVEINYLVEQITRTNLNVVISLHPRVIASDYSFLEEKYSVHISRIPLNQLLPIADLFVAVNSSTVFWAALCGIPAVVINFYGLDASLFKHLKNIRYVDERAKIFDIVENTASEMKFEFEEDWHNLSRELVFDGKVTQRYLDVVTEASVNQSI
jgi:hypothetical protein